MHTLHFGCALQSLPTATSQGASVAAGLQTVSLHAKPGLCQQRFQRYEGRPAMDRFMPNMVHIRGALPANHGLARCLNASWAPGIPACQPTRATPAWKCREVVRRKRDRSTQLMQCIWAQQVDVATKFIARMLLAAMSCSSLNLAGWRESKQPGACISWGYLSAGTACARAGAASIVQDQHAPRLQQPLQSCPAHCSVWRAPCSPMLCGWRS